MRLSKSSLLASAAALALGVGAAGVTTEAEAFDTTAWIWNNTATTTITKDITIDINLDPIGDINNQILQFHIGDVTAKSEVEDLENNKTHSLAETLTEVDRLDGTANININGSWNFTRSDSDSYSRTVAESSNLDRSGTIDVHTPNDGEATITGSGSFDKSVLGDDGKTQIFNDLVNGSFTGTVRGDRVSADYSLTADETFNSSLAINEAETEVDSGSLLVNFPNQQFSYRLAYYEMVEVPLDAVAELPEVLSHATALGNAIIVETDVPYEGHTGQYVANSNYEDGKFDGKRVDYEEVELELELDVTTQENFDETTGDELAPTPLKLDTENHMHNLATVVAFGGLLGAFDDADIEAVSEVDDIENFSVDSQAMAIANMKSIDLNTNNVQNAMIMSDISQVSFATVSATSLVGEDDGIEINNYNNFAALQAATGKSLVRSVATAIGNVVNIKLNSGQNTP